MTVVEAESVTRRFGSFTAVDGVTMRVEAGEVVGLLGANGAGKTTLIRMTLGLLEPSAGTVTLFGHRPTRQQRRRIGYVPQNLGLYADLSATENLEFRAEVFGSPCTDSVGDDLVGSLSLGDQRRTAFAAATQHHPELLILDEPTSGVSPLARSELWDLIHRHSDDGAAVLVSTHYTSEAEQADRVIIMAAGRVVATGPPADIAAGRTAVEVISDRWNEAFTLLEGRHDRIGLAGRSVRVLGSTLDAVTRVLGDAGLEAQVRTVPATLEEVLIDFDDAMNGRVEPTTGGPAPDPVR